MRSLVDESGNRWDVVLGKESWGTLVLLFTPADGSGIRKSVLDAETPRAAEAELDAMDDAALRLRLAEAVPWG